MGDALAKVLDQGVAPEKALADAVAQIKRKLRTGCLVSGHACDAVGST